MTISRANGLDIYYETAGAGPPLVLIHALPFDHNLWLYQVERFSARFRTVAIRAIAFQKSISSRAR
jgi:pimeloyl-ACP methyl ester carboxylesterase